MEKYLIGAAALLIVLGIAVFRTLKRWNDDEHHLH